MSKSAEDFSKPFMKKGERKEYKGEERGEKTERKIRNLALKRLPCDRNPRGKGEGPTLALEPRQRPKRPSTRLPIKTERKARQDYKT